MTAREPAGPRRLTALGRVIDPSRPSNRFALFAPAVTFVVVTLLALGGDRGFGGALGVGARDAVAVFLAWAIGRELDPDRVRTARYASFGAVVLLFVGAPDLAALFAVLLAARVVLRSTGLAPTGLDLVVAVGVAGWAATDATGLVPGLVLAGALVWDTRLPVRAPRRSGIAGVAALAVAVVAGVLGDALSVDWAAPNLAEIVVFVIAVAATTQLPRAAPRARADATREPLNAERLVKARILVAGGLAASLVWVGGTAIGALGGAWAALIATGVVRWTLSRRARVQRDVGADREDAPYPRRA